MQSTAIKIVLFLLLAIHWQNAKTNPIMPTEREIAFNRAKSLDNGISISWLDHTWEKELPDINGIKQSDFELLKQLGFKSIRLPVAFRYFEDKQIPRDEIFARVDKILAFCKQYGFKLIIDYHYGEINDKNYYAETNRVINTWTDIANKYAGENPDDLFFELYNEPGPMNPERWKDAIYNITTAVRKIDKKRTLLVGASNYNSIYELSRFVRLADENIIYVFHFYEPFLFTHQGAEWVGAQVATTGVPFPYSVEKFPQINTAAKGTAGEKNYDKYRIDGNEQSVKDKLKIVKAWGDKFYVPIICGEYGAYNKYADEQSRINYIKAVRTSLKDLKIPGIMWEYNGNFSPFSGTPSISTLSEGMKQALSVSSK